MERTKIIEIKGENYKLSIPTMRTSVLVESQVANLTRGAAPFLAISSSESARTAIDNAYKLARLEALVVKQKKTQQGLQDDYTFSFFDLDEEAQPLVDEISDKLEEFISSFRKGNNKSE